MLVLSRRKAESIRIGNDIEVYVVEIRGSRVRLGIRAPQEIPVLRSEVAVRESVGVMHDTASAAEVDMSAVPVLPRRPR